MKILFAAKDDFSYHRTKVLVEGLRAIDDVELQLLTINERNANFAKKLQIASKDVDFVYIPSFRHKDVHWIKKYSAAPVVFDPLISKYLTKVVDFGHWWKAPIKYFLDKQALKTADYILADTEAMRKYYMRKYGLNKGNTGVLPIGFIEKDFPAEKRLPKGSDNFIIGFYGSFVPLQGVDVIVKAAHVLRDQNDIQFVIIGSGYVQKEIDRLVDKLNPGNIVFYGWVKYEELAERISEFDLCLGVFGSSLKADLVVPNKVYHYAAMNKCIISKRCEGIQEVFRNLDNIVLCDADEISLANMILEMKNNWEQRVHVARNAGELIRGTYNEIEIAKRFIEELQRFLNEKSSK